MSSCIFDRGGVDNREKVLEKLYAMRETLEMEYIMQFLNWINAGIEAVFWVADFMLFCFAVMSATGLVINYICAKLFTKGRLTSKEDTTPNRDVCVNKPLSEVKEQITLSTQTENNSETLQRGNDKDAFRNSADLQRHDNRVDTCGTSVECDRNEVLSLMNASESTDLDIYTSGRHTDVNFSGPSRTVQLTSNEEEDLYRSVDGVKERILSNSGNGLKNYLISQNEADQNATKMEVEHTISLKNDNYHQLRKIVYLALVKGKQLPSWILTEEVSQWTLICSIQSETGRANEYKSLVEDQVTEKKVYEAIKFLMLYKAIHLHNTMENRRAVPEFCKHLFARSTSPYPYHLMINHLNLIGHTRCFEETEMELLKYTLEITMADSLVLK
ncbi:ubiquitin thioesterase otulin-like isoform X3 [Narcine bancroftii]|uniref:ubiquitin thioesterase otulin-like isoform X3 n=1 Tax=Narcine bancroftii TaxID=1343680 RepID=UPI003831EA1C